MTGLADLLRRINLGRSALTTALGVSIVVALLGGACAESSVDVAEPPDLAPPTCPSYSAADLAAARLAVASLPAAHGDVEPFIVLAAEPVEGAWVILRRDGSIRLIATYVDGDDQALALLIQPGDAALGDLVWRDTAIKDVTVTGKQVVLMSGCHH